MRFLANGPSIPDELLIARDEGRVVFFCGAGVSRARAGLSDFYGLAEKVVDALGVSNDDAVRKLLRKAKEVEDDIGVPGLISADRIFGLLERDFYTDEIENKVALALKPNPDADLAAHRILLDLSRFPNGSIKLVTTNFDLLFEQCDHTLPNRNHPHLPDPNRQDDFTGIIHLHGHVNAEYSGATGDGFVLSSSQFGDAYLASGWATQFIRAVLEKYIVVFIGYTADDPPVHYLLEALNRRSHKLQKMYAFQVGTQNDAEARWRHKGVIPIAFDGADDFKALWDSLSAWAERAVNPDAWYEKVIDMARKGPEELQPHERGQVAHLVSFPEGARKFASSDNPPPSEWLCVFDPLIRYLKPANLGSWLERGPFFEPFEAYGLDSDPVPPKIYPDDHYAKREVPPDSWNCFTPTPLDLQDVQYSSYPSIRGNSSISIPAPPARLQHLGHWICMVSGQPATAWWASHQVGLYPGIQERINHQMEKATIPAVRHTWRHIFTAWNMRKEESYHQWYQLLASIKIDGWTSSAVREIARIYRPYLTVSWPYHGGPKPPKYNPEVSIQDMVSLDVQYPTLHERTNIPDDFLVLAVREFRKNLELAIHLEKDQGSYEYLHLPPIESDPELKGESSDREFGIARLFFKFLGLYTRLIDFDPVAARKEYLAWWDDDYKVFALLKIWVSGQEELLSNREAGQLLCILNDQAFWDSRFQRDLLLVLRKRWDKFPSPLRKKIEQRLLAGSSRYENEEDEVYRERRAWYSLDRIHWLHEEGLCFSFNVQSVSKKLQRKAPKWQKTFAAKAAASMESRGGSVGTDTDYATLLGIPLKGVLVKAKELSGREFDRLIDKEPFTGLAAERPVRALLALNDAAKYGEWPKWAWRAFLYSQERGKDKPRFSSVIAQRLSRMPVNALATIINPAADWMQKVSEDLITLYRDAFEGAWRNVIATLRLNADVSKTALVRGNKEPDWVTEALNSPAGKLAQAIMNDPQKKGTKGRRGFPRSWLNRVEELLNLPGDHRRYALVIFTYNLDWFFYHEPAWVEINLISVLSKDKDDHDAFWDGFFWGSKPPSDKLFLRLKPWLLKMPTGKSVAGRREASVLSAVLLVGWGRTYKKNTVRLVTNDEMRTILLNANDDFRGQLLWHLGRWAAVGTGMWEKNLSVFFSEVWPRQKQAKSPKMSAKLCDLAFSSENVFAAAIDDILPLVTKIEEEGFILPHFRGAEDKIIEKYPERLLSLLWTVLPDNTAKWPYGIGDVLPKITEADPALLNDSRLIELRRRWNAR